MPTLTRTYHFDEVVTTEGICAAPDPAVAEAGADILRAGGNAVDAAVGAAFAEGVVEPWSSGVGGSATMTIALRDPDRLISVEGHMIAPAEVSNEHYPLDDRKPAGRLGVFDWPAVKGHVNLYGAKSVAIPGFVAALCIAQELFGELPRERVLQPAIKLAADGCNVNYFTAGMLAGDARSLARDPGCKEVFLPRGYPLRGPGPLAPERLIQPALAKTMEAIAQGGADAFYRGPVAEAMVNAVRGNGGLLTVFDLAGYRPTVTEPPLSGSFGPYDVVGAPRAGLPTVLQALYLYDATVRGDRAGNEGSGSHDDAVAWARSLYLAFTDRLRYMTTDPEVSVPWEVLRSRAYARAQLAAALEGREAPDPATFTDEAVTPAGSPSRPAAGGHTSHLSTVDRDGNLASLTGTVLNSFGARLLDPETGVLFNNGMGYFDPRPGVRNGIQPGLMVLSAMTPVVLCEGARGPVAALGASGGPRIISGVAQIIAALSSGRATLQQAIEEPRIHAESKTVLLDTRWPQGTKERIEAAGFKVELYEELPTCANFARPNGVIIDSVGRKHSGVDPIRPGDAAVG